MASERTRAEGENCEAGEKETFQLLRPFLRLADGSELKKEDMAGVSDGRPVHLPLL